MPSIHVDIEVAATQSIAATDTDGSEIDGEVVVLPLLIPTADVAAWIALYTSTDAASPSEADSRVIARCVLDALIVATS